MYLYDYCIIVQNRIANILVVIFLIVLLKLKGVASLRLAVLTLLALLTNRFPWGVGGAEVLEAVVAL